MPRELKYVDLIGWEGEGGWNKERKLDKDAGITMSLFTNSVCCGEYISKPQNLEDILEDIKNNWPTETHQMAGFHQHFSFKSINDYTRLMNIEFYNQFIKDMTAFGKSYPITNSEFWSRLENKNRFCRKTFIPEKQVKMTEKRGNDETRYTHLNFAWGIHKTLECRLFPTFISYKTAQAALIALVDCIENYLDNAPAVKEVIEEELSFEDDAAKSSDESVEVKSGLFKLKPFNLYEKRDIRPRRMTKDIMEKEMIMIKSRAASAGMNRPVGNRSFEEIIGQPIFSNTVSSGYGASSFEPTLSTLDSDDN